MLRKIIAVSFIIALVLVAVTGCGTGDSKKTQQSKNIVLRAGIAVTPDNPYAVGINKFGEIVKEKTNGRITIQLYHSGQLGSERDLVEGVMMGSLDLASITNSPISGFVPNVAALDLPYLFTSREHVQKVLDGPIGQDLFKQMAAKGIIGLGWWENGWRHVTNSKRPINKPEDLKGLKIRVMESPVPIATFNAVGANATPMAWGEVFTALQQGTIDAQENPMTIIYLQKMYEVQKYLSLTEHFYAPAVFMMSKATFDKLSSEDQKIILEAGKIATQVERDSAKKQSDEYLAKCKEKGMIVNEVDKSQFAAAMTPVHAQFEKKFGDLIKKIKETR